MLYYDRTNQSPIPDRFLKYNPVFDDEFIDIASNCIIVPEVKIKHLNTIKNAKKIVWWQSVDNFFRQSDLCSSGKLAKIKSRIKFELRFSWLRRTKIEHYAQSEYAKQYLKSENIPFTGMLTDYIGSEFTDAFTDARTMARKNQIMFNPVKGVEFTSQLRRACPDFTFIPLQGMSPSQIVQLCLESKVYIDFGEHPGKDRFPREAAILGCVIITGTRGSASNNVDIPIPTNYKFSDDQMSIPKIRDLIEAIFAQFETHQSNFIEYQNIIAKGKQVFDSEVTSLWQSSLKYYDQ